eukprot:COSAG05_NODE_1265_length_5336_cov_4.379607_5_plen_274_part_00
MWAAIKEAISLDIRRPHHRQRQQQETSEDQAQQHTEQKATHSYGFCLDGLNVVFEMRSMDAAEVVRIEDWSAHTTTPTQPAQPTPQPRSRYGGTPAPCDDAAPCEVSTRTGFRIATRLGPSAIPGAGLGRYATQPIAAGGIIRSQLAGSPNLLRFRSAQELRQAFPLPQDLQMLADFAFCSEAMPAVVLLDSPPTMVNHASEARGANTMFRFHGDVKEVVATRDIAVGDELLQDYRAIASVGWLEELLAGAELQSARQLGEQLERPNATQQQE